MSKRLLTVLMLATSASFARADEQRNASAFDGTYMIVSGERDGRPIPKEEIDGSIVVIKDATITGTDKDRKQFFACAYAVDKTSKPAKIAMTSTAPKTGEKANGVIEMDGDKLKICYALPGGDTPTDFNAKQKQQCFTLKKKE
jgi:uncharacterized protein (TIGR03067 family)